MESMKERSCTDGSLSFGGGGGGDSNLVWLRVGGGSNEVRQKRLEKGGN